MNLIFKNSETKLENIWPNLILFSQEFSEYVSLAPSLSPDSALPGLCSVENLSPRSGLTEPREPRESREASPVHSAARNLEQDTGDRDQYYQKVRSSRVKFCLLFIHHDSIHDKNSIFRIYKSSATKIRCFCSVFKINFLQVEFALKLGYPEDLTRKALGKVGLAACNVSFI